MIPGKLLVLIIFLARSASNIPKLIGPQGNFTLLFAKKASKSPRVNWFPHFNFGFQEKTAGVIIGRYPFDKLAYK
ncbi:hypothetical protein A3860_08455 [Niastella vici]|uniref:Uncharacterized protein n=1 Tax=Niastella vici TaxID=1703345 RepID=A0A1V9FH11_9BACT|nr:hypothetical protein A3860_08455 [Niastella vici]